MKITVMRSGATFVLVGFTSLSGACGGTPSPTLPAAKPAPEVAKPKAEPKGLTVAPRVCNGRKLVGALVQQLAQRARAAEEVAEARQDEDEDDRKSAPKPAGDPGRAPASFQDAYNVIAPATVVIKTDRGFGTGVVVDKSGLILTNFHVVAHGLQNDFRIKVGINFGKRSSVGGMELDEKSYEGWAVKTDRVRDLALIRVKDGPKELTVAAISKGDPSPGQSVAAVGHAGIGMLWAIKSCHVAAIGEPARNSLIAAKDCSPADREGLTDEQVRSRQAECESVKKEAQAAAASLHDGLFVQSDCRVAPGDSGGPLIDGRAEVVGLNQSVSTDRTTAAGTSYHVHVAELREFIANAPSEPVYNTPDPWCDGGTETVLEDIDMNGSPDGLVAKSGGMGPFWAFGRFSLLMDLDGRHLPEGGAQASMPFDAEAAFLSLPQGTFAWYDSNNDGRFDLLLSDREHKGKPALFDIGANGKLTERREPASPMLFDAAFIPDDAGMKTSLGRWALTINPLLASPGLIAEARSLVDVPDPVAGIPSKGTLVDADANGKPDAYGFQSSFANGLVMDLDGDSLGSLDLKADAAALVRDRKLDPELSFVVERGVAWVVYDTDNDKTHDLAMIADMMSMDRIAKAAYVRSGPGDAWKPAPDFTGMRSVRAALLNVPGAGDLVKKALPFAGRKDGLGSFPRPLSRRASYEFAKGKGAFSTTRTVLVGTKPGYSIWAFDADNNSKVGKDAATLLVQNKKFDAEVASIRDTRANLIWVYYDTDHDGAFDLVLYSTRPESGVAEKAFRIEGDKVRVDKEFAAGKLYRSVSVLKDRRTALGFRALAAGFLPAEAVED